MHSWMNTVNEWHKKRTKTTQIKMKCNAMSMCIVYIYSIARPLAPTLICTHRCFGIRLFGWFVYFHQANDGLLISILQKKRDLHIDVISAFRKPIHHHAWFNDDSRPRMRYPLWSEVNIEFCITSTDETERERAKRDEVSNKHTQARTQTHCNIYKQVKWFCIPIDSLRNQQTMLLLHARSPFFSFCLYKYYTFFFFLPSISSFVSVYVISLCIRTHLCTPFGCRGRRYIKCAVLNWKQRRKRCHCVLIVTTVKHTTDDCNCVVYYFQ